MAPMIDPFSGADVIDSRADEFEPTAADWEDFYDSSESDEGDGYGWAEEMAEEPW